MATTRVTEKDRKLTLAEVKEKYFPNRDLSSLDAKESCEAVKDTFVNFIKKDTKQTRKNPH